MEALRLLGSGSSQEIDQAIQPYSMTQEGRVAILRCIPGLLEPECPIRFVPVCCVLCVVCRVLRITYSVLRVTCTCGCAIVRLCDCAIV